jgi:hypothetical protein
VSHIVLFPVLNFIWVNLITIKTFYLTLLFVVYGILFMFYETFFAKKLLIYYLMYPLVVWLFDIVSGYTLVFVMGPRPATNQDENSYNVLNFLGQSTIIGFILLVRGINRYYKFI